MRLRVREPKGSTVEIDVLPHINVLAVKEILSLHTGIPVVCQQLWWKTVLLDDTAVLKAVLPSIFFHGSLDTVTPKVYQLLHDNEDELDDLEAVRTNAFLTLKVVDPDAGQTSAHNSFAGGSAATAHTHHAASLNSTTASRRRAARTLPPPRPASLQSQYVQSMPHADFDSDDGGDGFDTEGHLRRETATDHGARDFDASHNHHHQREQQQQQHSHHNRHTGRTSDSASGGYEIVARDTRSSGRAGPSDRPAFSATRDHQRQLQAQQQPTPDRWSHSQRLASSGDHLSSYSHHSHDGNGSGGGGGTEGGGLETWGAASVRTSDAPVRRWSVQDTVEWLASLGQAYGRYCRDFAESAIDGAMLVEICRDEANGQRYLQELGVKAVHSAKIFVAMTRLLQQGDGGRTPRDDRSNRDGNTSSVVLRASQWHGPVNTPARCVRAWAS
jgi:hypothetical protein